MRLTPAANPKKLFWHDFTHSFGKLDLFEQLGDGLAYKKSDFILHQESF
jgi:hypothetical protein